MESRVSDALENLDSILGNKAAAGDAAGLFSRLREDVDRTTDNSELESVCAKILGDKAGITRFLDRRSNSAGARSVPGSNGGADDATAIKSGLEFSSFVLTKMEGRSLLHGMKSALGDLAKVCLHLVRNYPKATVSDAAFDPLYILSGKFPEHLGPVLDEDFAKEVMNSLIEDYATASSTSKGSKSGWKQNAFKLMGRICKNFKKTVMENYFCPNSKSTSQLLWRAYAIRVLKVLKGDVEGEASFIAGCLDGMNELLAGFKGEALEDSKIGEGAGDQAKARKDGGYLGMLHVSYKAVCDAILATAGGDESRYQKIGAALRLLSNHSFQLCVFFDQELEGKTSCISLLRNLLVCTRHKNKEVRSAGSVALDSWFGCLSLGVAKTSPTCKLLIREFENLFMPVAGRPSFTAAAVDSDFDSAWDDQIIGIQGFGALAPFVNDDAALHKWFLQSGEYIETAFLAPESSAAYQVAYARLPETVIAMADIILRMKSTVVLLSRPSSDIIDKIFNTLFQNYTEKHSSNRWRYERAWFYLLLALDRDGADTNALEPMLQRTIKGAIITSIQPMYTTPMSAGRRYSAPGTMPIGYELPQPCIAYSQLWKNIRASQHTAWLERRGLHAFVGKVGEFDKIAGAVYTQMFQSIIDIIDALDLRVESQDDGKDEEEAGDEDEMEEGAEDDRPIVVAHASGMTGREKPANQQDFDMFLNLVLFFDRVATSGLDPVCFKTSYYDLCKSLVRGSTRNPLVSGFFKILAASMRLIQRGDFFRDVPTSNVLPGGDTVMQASPEAQPCAALIIKFAREVVARSDKVFDDLLISCLAFVLSIPSRLRDFEVQVPALQAALRLGTNDITMASFALTCLEKWVAEDIDQLRRHLPGVLPLLNDFLALPMLSEDGEETCFGKLTSGTAKKRDQKAQDKKARRSRYSSMESSGGSTSNKEIAVRVMKLLGKLGSDSMWLVQEVKEPEGDQDFDASTSVLQISMNGGKGSKGFVLVPVLPRIVQVAEHSTDKKLKMAACEALHGLTVLAIGNHNLKVCSTNQRDEECRNYENLFRFLFPVILRLAVSIEEVSNTLFGGLAKQIVHWFTSANRINMEVEAGILLDAVLDCLEFSSDGKVREGASKLVSEYVAWTLKGLGSDKNSQKPRQLFLRLYGLMNHPNVNKRIGSYLAAKELCSKRHGLRGHKSIVDQFILEILHNLVLSLKFVEGDDPALQTKWSAISALGAFKKIITEESTRHRLNKAPPPGAIRRLHPDLAHFVSWLFDQTGSHEKACRRYCMDLFVSLCGQEGLGTTPKKWVEEKKGSSLIGTFEADISAASGTAANIEVEQARLKHLITALDAYEWVLKLCILSPRSVFIDESRLSVAIQSFLEGTTSQRFSESLAPREHVWYQNLRSSAVYALIKFVATLLDTYPNDSVAKEWASKHMSRPFFDMVFRSLLIPTSAGLEIVSDPVVLEEIPKQAKRLLGALLGKHKDLEERPRSCLEALLRSDEGLDIQSMDFETSKLSPDALCVLLSGMQLLYQLPGQLVPPGHCSGDVLIEKVWSMVFPVVAPKGAEKREMTPVRKAVAESMLKLSFTLERDASKILHLMFDKGRGAACVEDGWQDSAGWVFYLEFQDCILEIMAESMMSASIAADSCAPRSSAVFTIARGSAAAAEMLLHLLDSRIVASRTCGTGRQGQVTEAVVAAYLSEFHAIEIMVQSACRQHSHCSLQQAIDTLDKIFNLCANRDGVLLSDDVLCRVVNVFRSCLTDMKSADDETKVELDMSNIAAIFRLLPVVLDKAYVSEKPNMKMLLNAVKALLTQLKPTNGDRESPNPAEVHKYQQVFGAVLTAVSNCRTRAIVPFLYDTVIVESSKALETQVRESLDIFVLGIEEVDATEILSDILKGVSSTSGAPNLALLRAKVEQIGLRIIGRLTDGPLIELFGLHCREFVEIMQLSTDDGDAASTLAKKIIVMSLLQAFYGSLPYTSIKDKVHPRFSDDPSKLTLVLAKALMDARKLDGLSAITDGGVRGSGSAWRRDENLRAIVYSFHRTVQNTLTTIIWHSQQDADPKKQKQMHTMVIKGISWENIVNLESTHKFKVMVNFKETHEALASFKRKQGVMSSPGHESTDIRRLVYGTMSQTVSATLQTFSSSFQESPMSKAAHGAIQDGSEIVLEDDGVNGFNTNECMRQFLKFVEHVGGRQEQGSAMPEWMESLCSRLGSSSCEANVRLFIAKIIINHFKLVHKTLGQRRDAFKPFARGFFEPFFHKVDGIVFEVIHARHRETENGWVDEAFNYFMRDICFLWMDWTSDGPEQFQFESDEQIDMGWNFIVLLGKIIMHSDLKVVSSNVQFFEHFYRCWRHHASQDHIQECLGHAKKLLGQFRLIGASAADASKTARYILSVRAGLNVMISITGIEQECIRDGKTSDMQRITLSDLKDGFDLLSKILTLPKNIDKIPTKFQEQCRKLREPAYMACAQVLSCAQLSEDMARDEECGKMREELQRKVNQFFESTPSNIGAPIKCLQTVVKFCPEFANTDCCWVVVRKYHMATYSEPLNHLQEMLIEKVACIWRISDEERRKSAAKEVVKELEARPPKQTEAHLKRLLVRQDDITQILALRLLTGRQQDGYLPESKRGAAGLLPFIDEDTAMRVLGFGRSADNSAVPVFQIFPTHSNKLCRLHFYHLVGDLCKSEHLKSLFEREEMHKFLAIALSDDMEKIRDIALEWWDGYLPQDYVERLAVMLEKMTVPDGNNSNWLCNATVLLLENAKHAQDYDTAFFTCPLRQECEFKDVTISASYKGGSLSSTPMWSGGGSLGGFTQAGAGTFYGYSQSLAQADGGGGIMATMADSTDYPSSMDLDDSTDDFLMAQTQQAGQYLQKRPQQRDDSSKGTAKAAGPAAPARMGAFAAPAPRVRFGVEGGSFGTGGSNIKKAKSERSAMARSMEHVKEAQKRSKQERGKIVKMTRRNYRDGEVPDIIVLKKDDVVRTLQKIVQMDSSAAKLVLAKLYESVVSKPDASGSRTSVGGGDVGGAPSMKDRLRASIEKMLQGMLVSRHQSTFSDLVEALLDVAHVAEVKLNAATVAQACSRPQCCTFYQGIRSLERQSMLDYKMSERMSKGKGKRGVDQALGPKKKRGQVLDLTDDDLLQLSRLYEKLEEKDIVLGMCEKVCKLDGTREAISWELLGMHEEAVQKYNELSDLWWRVEEGEDEWKDGVAPSDLEYNQWQTGIIKCLRGMLNWGQLDQWIENLFVNQDGTNAFEREIWEPENRDSLHTHMRCLVGLYGEDGGKGSELVDFVGDCWDNNVLANRKEILRSDFGLESALALLVRKRGVGALSGGDSGGVFDTVDAKEMVKKEIDRFLAEWSSSSDIGIIAKQKKLRVLQRVVELDEFIACAESKSGAGAAKKLVRAWRSRMPARHDNDHDAWNYIQSSRSMMLRLLDSQEPGLQQKIDDSNTRLFLTMAKVARAQNLLGIADQYLNFAKLRGGLELMCAISEAKLSLVRARHSILVGREDVGDVLDEARGRLDGAQELLEGHAARDRVKYFCVKGRLLGEIFSHKSSSGGSSADHRAAKDAFNVALEEIGRSDRELACLRPKVHFRLALFCDTVLDRSEAPSSSEYNEIVPTYIRSMLSAMASGSADANAHFSRVLDLLEHNFPAVSQLDIAKLLESVPNWMLLDWLPQLFSIVARKVQLECAPCLVNRLGQVAAQFPQAVFYAFRVVREDIARNKSVYDRMWGFLEKQSSGAEKLSRALQLLQHPDQQIRNLIDTMIIPKLADIAGNYNEMQSAFAEVYEDCISRENSMVGDLRVERTRQYHKLGIEHALGRLAEPNNPGVLSRKLTAETASKVAGEIRAAMEKENCPGGYNQVGFEHRGKKGSLLKISNLPLAHFTTILDKCESLSADEVAISIPGYEIGAGRLDCNGESGLIKLVSCDPDLKKLSSIMVPKRLKMRGSDGREYWWLAKAGDDLRQDQRVQHVFRAMNRILALDAQCAQRRLAVQTYKVVPLSKTFGIIEWVREMDRPLSEFFEKSTSTKEIKAATGSYQKFFGYKESDKNMGTTFIRGAKAAASSPSEFAKRMQNFQALVEDVPLFTLRDGLMAKAQTAQLEFGIRSNFAQSISAASMCQYILGIGDRHLGNMLVSDRSGKLLPIDFGHAFGSAHHLAVPELVPFRMTRQIVGVLAPLDAQGLLKRSMTYAMAALRNNKALIRRTMEIFATDPTVDWARNALTRSKQAKQQGGGEATEVVKWAAKAKINTVEQKLNGVHPSVITLAEMGQHPNPEIAQLCADRGGLKTIIEGTEGTVRKQLLEETRACKHVLNHKQQVDCLVDMATDSAVLCVAYGGWQPFL